MLEIIIALLVFAPNGLEVIEGMTKEQVLTRLGEPNEKLEMEVSRKAKWLYDKGEVLFQEGRVVEGDRPKVQVVSEPEPTIEKPSGKVLIGEILQGLPSDSGAAPPSPPLLTAPGEE